MKAAIIINNRVKVEETSIPSMGNNDVLVKMRACGICGSDLEKVYGSYGMKSSKVGHEPAGEIIDVGNNVQNFKKGDRVFIHHHVPCYTCFYCLNDDYTMCEKYQSSNIEPCGLSELIYVPEWNIRNGGLIKLPENITYNQAALIEPIACCLRSINKINFKKAYSVLIFGAGPTGLMHMILLRKFGAAKIILADINDFRLKFAKTIDKDAHTINLNSLKTAELQPTIDTILGRKGGVDISIVCTSSIHAFIESLDLTRKGGTISIFGVPSKESVLKIDLNLIYSKELKIFPSYATTEKEINQTITLLENKIINVDTLITHTFDLEHTNEAFESAHQAENVMKIIITSQSPE